MANYLILNQPQVWNGLGTLTYTVATTGSFKVKVFSTFPAAPPVNSIPNSNLAQQTVPGIGVGALGPCGAGSGMGLGAGTGGGGEGFTGGDLGTSHGGVGQGFGTGNSYQQPPSASSNATASSATSSSLSIVVNQNGTPLTTNFVSPKVAQSGEKIEVSFQGTAADTITVVLTSSASSDNQLSGVTSIISIEEGL